MNADLTGGALNPPGLAFAFRIVLEFDSGPRLRFEPAFKGGGRRGFVAVKGGSIEGPRLQGRVLPQSGGDWPRLWQSGLVEFEAHYLLEAADGTPIYVRNRGFAHASSQTQAKIDRGEPVDPRENYFRLAPVFETPAGPHDWMTRTVFVGYGEKHAMHSVFDYYAVL